jgi:hypothetical protein
MLLLYLDPLPVCCCCCCCWMWTGHLWCLSAAGPVHSQRNRVAGGSPVSPGPCACPTQLARSTWPSSLVGSDTLLHLCRVSLGFVTIALLLQQHHGVLKAVDTTSSSCPLGAVHVISCTGQGYTTIDNTVHLLLGQVRVVLRPGPCQDLHPRCAKWAEVGRCTRQPASMLELCQVGLVTQDQDVGSL